MDTTRSDRIKAGLQRSFRSGKSAKASIVCYGYRVDSKGKLQTYSAEAAHVLYIFERFAAGDSLGKISDALFLMDIPSPTGKEIWSKETISKILSNENTQEMLSWVKPRLKMVYKSKPLTFQREPL